MGSAPFFFPSTFFVDGELPHTFCMEKFYTDEMNGEMNFSILAAYASACGTTKQIRQSENALKLLNSFPLWLAADTLLPAHDNDYGLRFQLSFLPQVV